MTKPEETEVTYEVWREVNGKDPRQYLKGTSDQEKAERFSEALQRTPGLTGLGIEFYVVKATTTRERVG